MNWFFSRPKSNLPEPTALQAQRSKQIEQLKTFNQNVSEIHRDIEYRVNFIVNGTTLSLYITLPPQFPQEKPSVKVSPPVRHPWVNDAQLVTGCPGINNFLVHSDLGNVIRSVVEEFKRSPPTLLSQQSFTPGGMPYPHNPPGQPQQPPVPTFTPYPSTGAIWGGGYNMPQVQMPTLPAINPTTSMPVPPPAGAYPFSSQPQIANTGAAPTYQLPDLPSSFSSVHESSNQELGQVAEDEDRIISLLSGLPCLEKVAEDRQNLCKANEELARQNLAKKPLIEEQKRTLLEKYDLLNDLRLKFDESSSQQDMLRERFDPSVLQAKLKVAAMEAEEQAENVADSFLEGSIGVDEFLRNYMGKRKLSYLRKAKEEKLAQYILQDRGGF